jgi:hypothetical protein
LGRKRGKKILKNPVAQKIPPCKNNVFLTETVHLFDFLFPPQCGVIKNLNESCEVKTFTSHPLKRENKKKHHHPASEDLGFPLLN